MRTTLASYLPAGRRDGSLALVLGAAALLIWWHAAGPGAHAGYDFFTAYYSAASQVARGINPYQPLVKLSIDPELGGLLGRGYVYPPLLATLLAVPIRFGFNARACWLLWTLVNAVALIWMGRELNLNLRDSRSWTGTMAFCVACLLPAVVTYDLFLGQADLLMAALAVGACALRLRGRSWLGALVLGLAIAIKPTLGLLLLVWVWKGDWRAALRGALAAGIFIFLPFTLIGMAALQEYLGFLLHWNAFGANADFINQTPYALLLRIFTVNPSTRPVLLAPSLVTPLRIAMMAGAVLIWLQATPRRREGRMLDMCTYLLALPLILLLSPLTEDIHFTILAPTLAAFSWIAGAQHLQNRPAAWILWVTALVSYVPRMQELIYPNHLFILPGQNNAQFGALVTLIRTSALLWLAVIALLAGRSIISAVRNQTRKGWNAASLKLASEPGPGQESSYWHPDSDHDPTECRVAGGVLRQLHGDQWE